MAYYYSLRGWLETSDESFPRVIERLTELKHAYPEDSQFHLYMKGWCWANEQINWTHYVFYGADVQIKGLDLLGIVLDSITAMGCEVDGYFRADGEDGIKSFVYTIIDDIWGVREINTQINGENTP